MKLAVVVLAIIAASGTPAVPTKNVSIAVERSGCGAVTPNESISLAIGRNDRYPGDGMVWPEPHPFPWHGSFALATGYYSAVIANEKCWEQFYPFVVLSGHARHLYFTLSTSVSKPGYDYDVYTIPYGGLVGHLGLGESKPHLSGLGPRGDRAAGERDADVEADGWYYFDGVYLGSYKLEVTVNGNVVPRGIVEIKKDLVLRTDTGAYFKS